MTDDLDAALRAMLDEQSDAIPLVADPPREVVGQARRRRSVKLGALSGGGVAALVLIVGIVVVANDDSNTVDLVPATTADTPDPVGFAPLEPNAIVGARPDGTIVEYDEAGAPTRELFDAGAAIAEIDVVPGGTAMYVRLAGEGNCGEVRLVDLEAGTATTVGAAAGMAVSGNGRFLALSGGAQGGPSLTCTTPASGVVVIDRLGGGLLGYLNGGIPGLDPRSARGVAINHNGTRLAYEVCYEGCSVHFVEVPVDCLIEGTECDVVDPFWDDHRVLTNDSTGAFTTLEHPQFAAGELFAAECDCPDTSDPSVHHLTAFDASSGERIGRVFTFPQPRLARFAVVAADLVVAEYYDETYQRIADTVVYRAGEPTELQGQPAAEDPSGPGPTVATTTTPTPETDAVYVPDPLTPGSIVAARPDGTIVELDSRGNELQALYRAASKVQEIDVARDPDVLYVRVGYQLCGPVRKVDLRTGEVDTLGTATSIATSADGQWLALAGAPGADVQVGCDDPEKTASVTLRNVVTGVMVEFFDDTDYSEAPAGMRLRALYLGLSADGGRIAISPCYEECTTIVGDLPGDCRGVAPTCASPRVGWSTFERLEYDMVGYGAKATVVGFGASMLIVQECDGENGGSERPGCRGVFFDAVNGERGTAADLPPGAALVAVDGLRLLLRGPDGLRWSSAEPFGADLGAVALVPTG